MLLTHAQRSTPLRLALAAGMALLAGSPLAAQNKGGSGQGPSLQQMRQELQQVGQKVQQLQQKALQDSAMQQEQLRLQQVIEKKMNTIEPKTSDRTDRMTQLRGELQKAQQQQDTAKLRSLMMEAQKIQGQLRETQMKAMQDKDIAAKLDTFRTDLISQMNQIDPTADSLMDRMKVLETQIQKAAEHDSSGGGLR